MIPSMAASQPMQTGSSMDFLPSSWWSLNSCRRIGGSQSLARGLWNNSIRGEMKLQLFRKLAGSGRDHRGIIDVAVWRFQRSPSQVFSSRKDSGNISSLERLVKRSVKAEQEQKEEKTKEELPKPVKARPANTQIQFWMDKAQGVRTAVRIFTSVMTWIVLFFFVSVWDGESQNSSSSGKKNKKRGPRK